MVEVVSFVVTHSRFCGCEFAFYLEVVSKFMNVMLVNIGALACYLLGVLGQGFRIVGGTAPKSGVLGITALGAIFQGATLYIIMKTTQGFNVGVLAIASLTMLLVTVMIVVSSLKKPSEGLLLLILPITILSVITAWAVPLDPIFLPNPSSVMVAHVLTSVLAYGILMVAAVQSLLLSYQEHQLRNHRQNRLFKALPSLQTMERLMFEFLIVGIILLTLSLLCGFVFLENMFAKPFINKTVLSMVAWCIFATLLVGHWIRGWRGLMAMRWIVLGFLLLVVSYFGWLLATDLLIFTM